MTDTVIYTQNDLTAQDLVIANAQVALAQAQANCNAAQNQRQIIQATLGAQRAAAAVAASETE